MANTYTLLETITVGAAGAASVTFNSIPQTGYTDLVVDFRNIPQMQKIGAPVVMDITHSLQQPNQSSGVTGGKPELIETIAKAAIAVGTDGLFMETHPDPSSAKSDGANMIPLHQVEDLLQKLVRIRQAII
jgi:2-dehydro-3-deoxyphosphooctonate aldolase (KDO 8-P synthase)